MSKKERSHDTLGTRIKECYELPECSRRLIPLCPGIVRLDGRAFHSFTRGLARPFDERFQKVMLETTRVLVGEAGARVGYTQSDEISLLLYNPDLESELLFGGKFAKLNSILAGIAANTFVHFGRIHLPEKFPPGQRPAKLPVFDCRTFSVPILHEAANVFVWRQADCTRNAISMAAQSVYSHRELLEKNSKEQQEMLFQKGINFNDYPWQFKRGVFVQHRKVKRKFSIDEIEKLPPKHAACTNPDLEVTRSEFVDVDYDLRRIANRVAVLFDGIEPQYGSEVA